MRRDELVVIDVEATCWEGQPPPGQQSEIIEIGVCLLAVRTRQLSNKRSILIRPERSRVSAFCTKLTTLTQELVEGGTSFREACAVLENDYATQERLWGSWGNYDRQIFQAQCESWGVPYPFCDRHANLKQAFASLHDGKRRGMGGALRVAGLPLEGTHHRGDDDAWNIGRLAVFMLERFGEDFLLDAYG